MDIKKLLKTYGFWISVASGLFLLFQFVFKCFGIVITEGGYMAVVNGILSIFVMLGIVAKPPLLISTDDESENNSNEEKVNKTDAGKDKDLKSKHNQDLENK